MVTDSGVKEAENQLSDGEKSIVEDSLIESEEADENKYPHEVIKGFVEEYKKTIKPLLEAEQLEGAKESIIKINNDFINFKAEDLEFTKKGVFSCYEKAVNTLFFLSEQEKKIKSAIGEKEFNQEILKPELKKIDAEVEKLNALLSEGD
jgi:hypothetical protein